jgi:endo-1,4-beta-xylanase
MKLRICRNQGIWLFVFALLFVFSLSASAQTDAIQTDVPALREVYAHDFYIGCLLSYRNIGFTNDPAVPGQSPVATPQGGYLIKFHMNSMSPGNNMKPQYTVDITASAAAYAIATDKDYADTHPVIKFNGDIIAQLNWAKRQGFTFRGHTLVWHSQTPATFFRSGYTGTGARLSKEKMIQRMDHYMKEVFRLIHEGWPGLLSAMDVVNEAVNENGSDRTTDSEWFTTFGDNSYLLKAFELARKYATEFGETQIKLYYNDYNTNTPAKADGIVRICTPIFQAGYLDGIGMQEHDSNTAPGAAEWIASYNKFAPICTEMAVTELDVTTGSATPTASILARQANQYGQLLKCFVERSYFSGRGKIISVSKDGLNDQYTFKTNQSSSLWDSMNKCKPAFYAVANIGLYYNALDSLLAYAGGLTQNEYTVASWSSLTTALTGAHNTMTKNYTYATSAADSLLSARNNLVAAIDGLSKTTGVKITDQERMIDFALQQNYPNPFNASTNIHFSLAKESRVSLKIYDLLGREVKNLVEQKLSAGKHTVQFAAEALQSGSYFYRLSTDDYSMTRRMTIIR